MLAQRQPHRERAAAARSAVRADLAAVQLDQLFCQGEANTGPLVTAGCRCVHLVEPVVHARQLIRLDAHACVVYDDFRNVPGCADGHRHAASARRELERIREQVEQHLLELFGIETGNELAQLAQEAQADALALCERCKGLWRCARETNQIVRPAVERDGACLQPGQVQDLVVEAQQALPVPQTTRRAPRP